MKWLPFTVLAALAIICQTTIARAIAIHGVSPDLMFVLAVFYALWGPWPDAAIAAWILGFIFDIYSVGHPGLFAFCYGAAAFGIIRIRQIVYREYAITQLLITFVFTLLIQVAAVAFSWWRSPAGIPWGAIWWPAIFTAVYTAGLAPYLHWALTRLSRWTGLKTGGRTPAYR